METIYKKPKRATKSKNEQPKAFACFGFSARIDFLFQKQERTTKSSKKQQMANGNIPPKPKRATTSDKKQQRAFFIPILIHLLQFWAYGRWLISRAMKNQKEQQRAMKSSKEQQETKANIWVKKLKTGNKKPNEQQRAKKLQIETRLYSA